MRRHAFDLVLFLVLATIVALFLSFGQPSIRGIVLHAYVLMVGALAMIGLIAATSDSSPRRGRSDFETALEHRARDRALPEIERMQREVTLATASEYDLHYRLLPHLREIARARLQRRGQQPGPDTLGRWWELLRPDREPPEQRFSGGLRADELRACLDDLERI